MTTSFAVTAATATQGAILQLGTGVVVKGFPLFVRSASAAATEVVVDLPFPADARIEDARFDVTAAAEPEAELASVAQVRPATAGSGGAAAAVDFGRLVTVSGVFPSTGIGIVDVSGVDRWSGTDWVPVEGGAGFAEIATERLRVHASRGSSAELVSTLLGGCAVGLPVRPSGLELLVDGVPVWFERQGSSPGAGTSGVASPRPAAGDGAVAHHVDRTDAVREALTRAADVDGTRTVRVTLRAATPGRLSLVPHVRVLRVHRVAFPPDGAARTVEAAEEGLTTLAVTPPGAADVREVELTVRGSFGPERVVPPTGPTLLEEVALALAPGRTVLVGLPATLTARLGTLTGIRLALRAAAGTSGGEVTGRLLASLHTHTTDPDAADSRPGDPVPGGALTPVVVTDPTRRWYTLPLAAPVAPPPPPLCAEPDPTHLAAPGHDPGPASVALWLELQLGYGDVEFACTRAAPDAEPAPGGPLLRRLPGGGTAETSRIPALGPLRAAVRAVGRPARDRPLPAVTLGVGTDPAAGAPPVLLGLTPGARAARVRLTAAEPLPVAGDTPVHLTVLAAAAGSLTVEGVEVAYREAGS